MTMRSWVVLSLLFFRLALTNAPAWSGGISLRDGIEGGSIRTIAVLGDSIVSGYGVRVPWPGYLARELSKRHPGISIINAGKPGDTAADSLERIDTEVLSRQPDLVLVSFGLNEMRRRIPTSSFRSALRTVIDKVSGRGARVALLTTLCLKADAEVSRLQDIYNDAIRQTAREKGTALIDVYEQSRAMASSPSSFIDLVHPTVSGHQQLADIVFTSLMR